MRAHVSLLTKLTILSAAVAALAFVGAPHLAKGAPTAGA